MPQYNPQVVYVQPDPSAVVAASVLSFGAGIFLGAWITNNTYPWEWGGWGWNWGGRTVIVHNHYWIVNNRYRPPRPYYHYRPPVYGRPIYVRPPRNWHYRPYYRPPPSHGRPPGNNPGNRPPTKPGTRPPSNPGTPPPSKPGTRPPSTNPENRPPSKPQPQSAPPSDHATIQPVNPGHPSNGGKLAPGTNRPSKPYQPNPAAGYPKGQGGGWSNTGGRTSAFGGGNNAGADRAAVDRGRSSVNSEQKQKGGGNRK